MYLDLLESRGIKVKELASGYLSKKYNQPKSVMFSKITKETNEQGVFSFQVTDKSKGSSTSSLHKFDDFGYQSDDCANDDKLSHGIIDLKWIRIVQLALNKISIDLSNEYFEKAQQYLEEVCSTFKSFVEKEAKERYSAAVLKASNEMDRTINNMLDQINILRSEFEKFKPSNDKELTVL